jgi:hypothetical protein
MSNQACKNIQRGILMFDLNGTLCSLTKHRYANGNTITVRPCIEELKKLSKHFHMVCWTSATEKNACWMTKQVEKEGGFQFDKLLHRDHCIKVENTDKSKTHNATIKDILKYTDLPNRTLLIDDSNSKIKDSHKDMHVEIPPYTEKKEDKVLVTLVEQLLLIKDAPNFKEHSRLISSKLQAALKNE